MQGTPSTVARNKQLLDRDVAEKALLLSIENADLDKHTIKALRRTCKRTKVAADAKVKKFRLDEKQEPEAVQCSGLLKNMRQITIYLDLYDKDVRVWVDRKLSNSLALLKLAVENCSKSLEVLDVDIGADSKNFRNCARIVASILGTATWESLEQLQLAGRMPGLLSAFLANLGSLPALKTLVCYGPSAADLELLHNSSVLGSLKKLHLGLYFDVPYDHSSAARVAAMRSLLQKATNLKTFILESNKFDFFDSENLVSLESLCVQYNAQIRRKYVFAPVLARPWLNLHSLYIESGCSVSLEGSELVRIFEAEDTLPVLKNLRIKSDTCALDAPTCVRRPYLEEFHLSGYRICRTLISKLAQLMKEGKCALPKLKIFQFDFRFEVCRVSARIALSEFLSCAQMATLESLTIVSLGLEEAGRLASDIKKYCPNLKHLKLS